MNTTFLVNQHIKAIRILEAIDKNEYFTQSHERDLKLYSQNYPPNHIQFKKKRIEAGKAIAERLQRSYQNIMSKISSQELKQAA